MAPAPLRISGADRVGSIIPPLHGRKGRVGLRRWEEHRQSGPEGSRDLRAVGWALKSSVHLKLPLLRKQPALRW